LIKLIKFEVLCIYIVSTGVDGKPEDSIYSPVLPGTALKASFRLVWSLADWPEADFILWMTGCVARN
jgi:hypothetical protein